MNVSAFKRFLDDESGSITAFLLIMFLIMLVGGGMAVDFMRHESERVIFQDTLDRGVLAAASFEQLNDPEDVVRSYLTANGYDLNALNLTIDAGIGTNSRSVDAYARYDVGTFFLRIIGIETLDIAARSTAATGFDEIEISLVVDVSRSMEGSKLQDLKDAANTFVDLMISDDARTTISLIPFSGTVAPSAELASHYNLSTWHDLSHCFVFQDADFSSTALSTSQQFDQELVWAFDFWPDNRWCLSPNNQIVPFEDDAATLHSAINGMSAEHYTATWAGLKWGAALLDPAAQPVVANLSTVNSTYHDRPADWGSDTTLKILILMSDGANTENFTVESWNYNHENTDPWKSQENADYWNTETCSGWNGCSLPTPTRKTNFGGSTGDIRLQAMCEAAKSHENLVLYTIGFEVALDSNPYEMMRLCASDEHSTFFHAIDGDALEDAFRLIATSVEKLRLIN